MAEPIPQATPLQCLQGERFTTKQNDHKLCDLSPSLSEQHTEHIAVSGILDYGRSFIDVYSRNGSDSKEKFKFNNSREFESDSGWNERFLSFFGSQLLTTVNDKIEILDVGNGTKALLSSRVGRRITCIATGQNKIVLGLFRSKKMIVLNNDLQKTNEIMIEGVKDNDFPLDLQVGTQTVFICTLGGDVLSVREDTGRLLSRYRDTTGKDSYAVSTAVSEILSLFAVLWSRYRIIIYSLTDGMSFLVFDVDSRVSRIRISDSDRMIITGSRDTGKIKMYGLELLFSFEGLKKTLAHAVSRIEVEQLMQYCGVKEEEIMAKMRDNEEESGEVSERNKMECLLMIIEEKGRINPYNISYLKDAVSSLENGGKLSDLQGPLEGYSLHCILGVKVKYKYLTPEMITGKTSWEEHQLSLELDNLRNDIKRKEESLEDLQRKLEDVTKQSEEQETTLRNDLKNAEGKIIDLERQITDLVAQNEASIDKLKKAKIQYTNDKETLTDELKQTKESLEALKEELKHITEDRDNARAELKQDQPVSAKQPKNLKEVPSPTKLTLSKRQKVLDEDEGRQKMDKLFQDLSRQIGTEWRELGRELQMTDEELGHIKTDHVNSREINNAILRKWYQKNGSAATFTVLMKALQTVGRKDLAEHVQQFVRNREGTPI